VVQGAPRTTKERELESQNRIWQRPGMEIKASSFKLRANAPEGRKAISYQPTTATSYTVWSSARIGIGNSSLANADPDQDGLSNLAEYAFGRDPNRPDPTLLPRASAVGEFPSILLEGVRSELTYTVEVSTNLILWRTLAINPGQIGGTVSVSDPIPLNSEPRRFFRVRVAQP
jgi:hypothetical protein